MWALVVWSAFDRGRLSGPIRAQKRKYFTLGNVERDIVHRGEVPESLHEILNMDQARALQRTVVQFQKLLKRALEKQTVFYVRRSIQSK